MNIPNTSTRAIETVSSKNPCVHCQKPDWCYVLLNGASCCKRSFINPDYEDSGKKDKQGSPILYPKEWGKKKPKPQVLNKQEWLYYGRDGKELVKVIRLNLDDGSKDIFQNYKGKNGWIKKRPLSIERSDIPVYRLDLVKEAIENDRHIFIVEGEKCADLLISMGLIATTNIQGSGNYSDSDLKDFWDKNTNGYHNKIILCPDRDELGLKLIKQWEQGLGSVKWLFPFPEKDWANVPPNNGLDLYEWIVDNQLSKQDVIDAIGKKPESLKVEVKTSTPLAIAQTYTDDSNPDKSSDESDEPIILPPSYSYQERAVTAIYGRGKYLSYKEELYKYNGKYYELLESELEGLKIRDWAKNEREWDNKEKRYVYKYLTPACLKGIWEWAIITFAVSTKLINPPGLNLANGILTIFQEQGKIKSKLLPHSPDKYFLYCSEVAYNPDADPTECNNLLKALDPPQRKIFAQTLAASLDLAWVRKKQGRIKAIIAKGTGSNGKDSIKSAIARIFTPELICNVPFSSFKAYDNGSKYDLTKLRDKKINWASENNQTTVLDRSESLNCAITGNGIDYRDMNKLPKEFEPVCINIFNVNIVPKATGGLESFLSRFAVIEFNKTFANDPDESQDQIKADARFAYDPDFMRDEVCPAFLNLLLEEFPNVVDKGIDYSPLKSSLDILQEDSNHLFGFIRDYKIVADPKDRIYVADLWECLTAWYIANGTLEFEELNNGNKKPIWHDQSNKYDRNIVASNQVIPRFKEIFPKSRGEKETKDPNRKNKAYIAGIGFSQETKGNEPSENDKNSEQVSSTASLPHHAQSTRVVASPIASLPLTSPSQEESKAVGKAVKAVGEAVTTVYQESEAVRQCDRPDANAENHGKWFPISTVGLENLYMGDWVARLDGTPLKLGARRKNFWEAIIPDTDESLEVPFSEIIHVYR